MSMRHALALAIHHRLAAAGCRRRNADERPRYPQDAHRCWRQGQQLVAEFRGRRRHDLCRRGRQAIDRPLGCARRRVLLAVAALRCLGLLRHGRPILPPTAPPSSGSAPTVRATPPASLQRDNDDMDNPRHNIREVRAPRGDKLNARSWLTEAPLRMLMNNLDPDVAENPNELVVYGGIGRAARTWNDFDQIVASLKSLGDDETLLVQSGKPVGVFRTHADAPRVLIANSNLVPHWANWAHFNELDKKGLMMYGQMTAGSWIYIGTQGIVQGTYETFVEAGRQHYDGSLKGKWILTAGLGGMGGAQPLAAVMAGACCLAIECDSDRIDFRLRTRYVDERAETLDEALDKIERWTKAGEAKSVGLARQCRRHPAGAGQARRAPRHRHRPDLGARSAQRLSAERLDARRMARQAQQRSEGGGEGGARLDARACRGDGGVLERRRADARLRQQHPPGGARGRVRERLRVPRLRAGLYPPAVLPRHRPVPLGGAVGRSRGHLQDRRQGARADARQHASAQLA